MPRLAFVVISLVIVAGCRERNGEFCPNGATADSEMCIDAPPGMGDHCTTTIGCTDPMHPICDTAKNGGTCIACTKDDHSVCMGLTPHCDLDTESCVACVDDIDCGGTGVCLQNTICADPTKIIHAISSGGSSAMATCGGIGTGNACDLDTALAVAKSGSGGRNVIKLDDPGPYKSRMNNFTVDVDSAFALTIDARNAVVHPNGSGAIFNINDNKGVTIIGGIIENAQGNGQTPNDGGDGIRCGTNSTLIVQETILRANDESGIDASSCTVTVTNATVRDNSKAAGGTLFAGIEITKGFLTISRSQITSNRGGGISVGGNGKFVVVGNAFLGNGDIMGSAGGISFTTSAPGNRLEFNTFAENKSSSGVGSGIQCLVAGFMAQNNIVWNNNGATGVQVGGNCLHAYSDIGPNSVIGMSAFDGGNNISADPKFNGATTDLSLNSMTPVRGKANPDADLTDIASKDMAGKPRIKPADLGAYQAPP